MFHTSTIGVVLAVTILGLAFIAVLFLYLRERATDPMEEALVVQEEAVPSRSAQDEVTVDDVGKSAGLQTEEQQVDEGDDQDSDPAVVELPRPEIRGARFGMLQVLWRLWKHHVRRKKLASKGYVQWYLVDDTWPVPKYVKPKFKGGGVRELEYDDGRYLFPESARLPSEEQGLWTFVHHYGEAEPRNLGDPVQNAMRADAVEEYLQARITTSPPSWFSNFDIDPQDAIMYLIVGIVAYAFLRGFF